MAKADFYPVTNANMLLFLDDLVNLSIFVTEVEL